MATQQSYDAWHQQRRAEILKKYPQVKQLMTNNVWTAVISVSLAIIYFAMSIYLPPRLSFLQLSLVSYFIACLVLNGIGILMHDIYHNLAFKTDFATRMLLLVLSPASLYENPLITRMLHRSHHGHLEHRGRNPEHPSDKYLESKLFELRSKMWYKLVCFLPFFSMLVDGILLPMIIPTSVKADRFKAKAEAEAKAKVDVTEETTAPANAGQQVEEEDTLETVFARIEHEERHWIVAVNTLKVTVELTLLYFYGLWPLIFRLMSESYFAVHILVSARGYGEHVPVSDEALKRKQLTFSRYGYINYLTFNVAHHVEHHDLPNIPWSNLPALRAMAPEFYDTLVEQEDWVMLWFRCLIGDPRLSREFYMPAVREKHKAKQIKQQ